MYTRPIIDVIDVCIVEASPVVEYYLYDTVFQFSGVRAHIMYYVSLYYYYFVNQLVCSNACLVFSYLENVTAVVFQV